MSTDEMRWNTKGKERKASVKQTTLIWLVTLIWHCIFYCCLIRGTNLLTKKTDKKKKMKEHF